jgi:hypothetical protein
MGLGALFELAGMSHGGRHSGICFWRLYLYRSVSVYSKKPTHEALRGCPFGFEADACKQP